MSLNDLSVLGIKFWVNMSLPPVIWASFGLPYVKKKV